MRLSNIARCALRVGAALQLGASVASAGEADRFGRSVEDLAIEDFLLHAEIVEIVDVGEGITRPKRLTLKRGDEQHRAILKTVDVQIDDTVLTDRVEHDFSDKYTYEAAAYRLDRLLGLGLVPATIIRTVEGEAGSVQLWIEDVRTFEEAVNDETAEVENYDLLVERLGLMYVLDALIFNVDRNFGNILVNLDRDVFHPIDHSRAFRLSHKPPPSTRGSTDRLAVPDPVRERLEALDFATLDRLLGELMNQKQVRAILKRRDRLIKMLDKQNA
ncbi:MAG: hypothetical protein GY719_02545 [bacterium]|nr:hypothetical protein [bacterium]